MLSTENPPPDPPCSSSEISQLKKSDERASDDKLEVDLFKSVLDDNNPHPKFSIRDYVFSTRGKDIKTHWPFSPKNLQLCLKHGVKDVLPPFQTLDSVRNNPSIGKCAVENISNSAVNLSANDGGTQKLALNIKNIKSSGSEEDKEYPSTTTSLSCSDVNSVNPLTKKPESINTQNPVKKCRLIVKLGNISEPKTNEELSLTETMASKVCPVCKTFSSSSNTTLNAHIDQCLSGESTIKWTTNSKVIKHRIKPRKTRLMVDIYATAQCCTLEDLDRRNGTNWASNLGLTAPQDLELYAEEKNDSYLPVNSVEDKNKNGDEEGAVYFDSNGTKLRILSKFPDLQSNSNAKDDCGHRKLVKRDKGCKLLSCKKKKYLVQKHKLVKCPPSRQRSCSPMPNHCPEVRNGQERKLPPEEDEKEDVAQPLEAHDQMKSNGFEMIKQWVGSKRTGLKKKINPELESDQHPDKIIKNLRVKSNLPSLGEKFIKRTRDSSFPISSDDTPLLSTESHKRNENLSSSSRDEYMDQPRLRKRVGVSFLESRDCSVRENSAMFPKCSVKKSTKDGDLVYNRYMGAPNGMENHASSRGNKKMRSISPINPDSSLVSSRIPQQHKFSSGCKEFGSLKKKSLSHAILCRANKPSSKKKLARKHMYFKRYRLRYTSGSDDEAEDRYAIDRQDNLVEAAGKNAAQMEKASCKPLIDEPRVLKIRKRRGESVNTGKDGGMALRGPNASPESDNHGVEKNFDSFVYDNVPAGASNVLDDAENEDEFVCEPKEAFIAFGESLESGFATISGCPSDVELVSQHYVKAYDEGRGPADLVLDGKEQIISNSHAVADDIANEEQGNYFVDVDPIPIPGPPGSFLPSPGRMGSEEVQGNSSLTTCRIHSSEDEHELIDMDSSDSPVSATSFASNSVANRSDSVSYANLTMQSHGAQHESQGDMSELAIGAFEKRKLDDESRTDLIISPEMSPRRFKNSQPCCCSRKEGVSQSGALTYQESQLLRRRATTSLPPLPSQKRQIDHHDLNNKFYTFNEPLPGKEQTPEPEKVVANSPKEYAAALVSHSTESKSRTCGDCDSPSPSTPNPVLRLMGKNLMVVNKEETLNPQTRPTQPSLDNVLLSSGNIQNEPRSFHTLSRGLPIFDNTQMCSMPAQQFPNFRIPDLSSHPSRVVLSSQTFGGGDGLTSSLECRHEYAGRCNFSHDQLGSNIRLDNPVRYEVEKVRNPVPRHKEIIVIDDSPENEAGDNSVGISEQRTVLHDPRNTNPFYSYQTRCYPFCGGSQMVQNANTQAAPLSKRMNENLVNWNNSPGGSTVLHQNSLTASSPSTGQLRSSLYFSPGFSSPTNFT